MILDLISAHQPQGSVSIWTPAQLFQGGEIGWWFDGSDLSTMFQDAAGTVPVTAVGQTVGLWKNKINQPLFNLSQATSAARPVLQAINSSTGLRFDGIDDRLAGNSSVTVSYDTGATVAVGQKKSNNENSSMVSCTTSPDLVGVSNTISGAAAINMNSQTLTSTAILSLVNPNVITGSGGTFSDMTVRVNGVATVGSVVASDLYNLMPRIVGENRNNCDISQCVFINRVLTPAEITQLETYIVSRQ